MANVRKAAVLLMSLPEEEAGQVLGKLTPKQVEAVSIEIAKLGNITGDEQEIVINEFADSSPSSLSGGKGGFDIAKNLVERALGKNAGDTLDNVRQQIEALPFGFLQKVDSQNLLTFIIDEHPQTIALILSHLPPAQGAEIIAGLPTERQLVGDPPRGHDGANESRDHPGSRKGARASDVERDEPAVRKRRRRADGGRNSQRHRSCDRTHPAGKPGPGRSRPGRRDSPLDVRLRRPDEILRQGHADGAQERRNLAMGDGSQGRQRGAAQKILGNMSSRAADMLREEMEYLGPVKLSAVEQMQQQIVDIVRRLEDAGEISMQSDDASEQLIQ